MLSFTHLGSKFTDFSNNSHAFQHRAEAHMMIGVGTLLPHSRFSVGGSVGDVPLGDFRYAPLTWIWKFDLGAVKQNWWFFRMQYLKPNQAKQQKLLS